MNKILNKITNWQAWPFKLLYAPISLVWLWYIIKSGAVWFFTPSNPKLTFGGMEGEPKKEMYDLLPKHLYPTTFNVTPNLSFDNVLQMLDNSLIQFPLIVKPEIGGQGILFRKIDNEKQLQHYHSLMKFEYIVQEMVHYPMEVSVFYIRHPKKLNGIITGFLHKIPLHIFGNGINTLQELITQNAKANKQIIALETKHVQYWNTIIPKGEKYMLSYAANHNRGAQFIDLKDYIDKNLVQVFDKISLTLNDFFYGRYDIMCTNIDDLKKGINFSILEYNGCGAEPNHFYDTGYTLIKAYKEILMHWKWLYKISAYNKKQGIKTWPFNKGRKFLSDTRTLYAEMKKVDLLIG